MARLELDLNMLTTEELLMYVQLKNIAEKNRVEKPVPVPPKFQEPEELRKKSWLN